MTRWSDAFSKKSTSKYGAIKVQHGDRSFASKMERARYAELLLLEKSGKIKDIECQVQVILTEAEIIYKPDFKYFDLSLSKPIWEEVKGFETDTWRLKRKLWISYGPGILRVYKGRYSRLRLHEEITPKKK